MPDEGSIGSGKAPTGGHWLRSPGTRTNAWHEGPRFGGTGVLKPEPMRPPVSGTLSGSLRSVAPPSMSWRPPVARGWADAALPPQMGHL